MYGEISNEEREKTIQYLMNNVPKEDMNDVLVEVEKKGSSWWHDLHFGFGIYVRNTLRKGGFEKAGYDLDDLWGELIEDAARRQQKKL